MDRKFDGMTEDIYKATNISVVFEKIGEIWEAYNVNNGNIIATYNPKTDLLLIADDIDID